MSELMVIGCGGAGINVMKDVRSAPTTKLLAEATYLGLDTSERNNLGADFDIVQMNSQTVVGQKAQGSGKDISLNFEGYTPFITEVFKTHKVPKFVIVVMSVAGGSGSGLGFSVLRYLLSRGVIAVGMFIPDYTSLVERRNSNKIMTAIANQTQQRFLGKVIPFMRVINDDRTRRVINDEIILNMNYCSLFMTETNEELDIEDIRNLFQYSKVTGLPPAMSEINFFADDAIEEFTGRPPVSFCSIFDHRDNVRPLFKDSAYRATGVINFENNPPNKKVIVMTLDHGDYIDLLEQELAAEEEQTNRAKATFVKPKDLSAGADDSGMVW